MTRRTEKGFTGSRSDGFSDYLKEGDNVAYIRHIFFIRCEDAAVALAVFQLGLFIASGVDIEGFSTTTAVFVVLNALMFMGFVLCFSLAKLRKSAAFAHLLLGFLVYCNAVILPLYSTYVPYLRLSELHIAIIFVLTGYPVIVLCLFCLTAVATSIGTIYLHAGSNSLTIELDESYAVTQIATVATCVMIGAILYYSCVVVGGLQLHFQQVGFKRQRFQTVIEIETDIVEAVQKLTSEESSHAEPFFRNNVSISDGEGERMDNHFQSMLLDELDAGHPLLQQVFQRTSETGASPPELSSCPSSTVAVCDGSGSSMRSHSFLSESAEWPTSPLLSPISVPMPRARRASLMHRASSSFAREPFTRRPSSHPLLIVRPAQFTPRSVDSLGGSLRRDLSELGSPDAKLPAADTPVSMYREQRSGKIRPRVRFACDSDSPPYRLPSGRSGDSKAIRRRLSPRFKAIRLHRHRALSEHRYASFDIPDLLFDVAPPEGQPASEQAPLDAPLPAGWEDESVLSSLERYRDHPVCSSLEEFPDGGFPHPSPSLWGAGPRVYPEPQDHVTITTHQSWSRDARFTPDCSDCCCGTIRHIVTPIAKHDDFMQSASWTRKVPVPRRTWAAVFVEPVFERLYLEWLAFYSYRYCRRFYLAYFGAVLTLPLHSLAVYVWLAISSKWYYGNYDTITGTDRTILLENAITTVVFRLFLQLMVSSGLSGYIVVKKRRTEYFKQAIAAFTLVQVQFGFAMFDIAFDQICNPTSWPVGAAISRWQPLMACTILAPVMVVLRLPLLMATYFTWWLLAVAMFLLLEGSLLELVAFSASFALACLFCILVVGRAFEINRRRIFSTTILPYLLYLDELLGFIEEQNGTANEPGRSAPRTLEKTYAG